MFRKKRLDVVWYLVLHFDAQVPPGWEGLERGLQSQLEDMPITLPEVHYHRCEHPIRHTNTMFSQIEDWSTISFTTLLPPGRRFWDVLLFSPNPWPWSCI